MSGNSLIDPTEVLEERMKRIRRLSSLGSVHREFAILSSELASRIGVRASSGRHLNDLVLSKDGSASLSIDLIDATMIERRVRIVEERVFSESFNPSYMEWMMREERGAEGNPWTLVRLLMRLCQTGEVDVRLTGLAT